MLNRSLDSLLTSLKIEGYSIDFKKETTLYNLKIKDEDTELKITTTTEDPEAKVEIEGNKDLINGSIIYFYLFAIILFYLLRK